MGEIQDARPAVLDCRIKRTGSWSPAAMRVGDHLVGLVRLAVVDALNPCADELADRMRMLRVRAVHACYDACAMCTVIPRRASSTCDGEKRTVVRSICRPNSGQYCVRSS